MITEIYPHRPRKKQGDSREIEPIPEKDALRVVEALSIVRGVTEARVIRTDIADMVGPLGFCVGWSVEGEFNPSDVYKKACDSGYSIKKSNIRREVIIS